MKRDQWLRACAQRFIDKQDIDPGEAAAYAKECEEQMQKAGVWKDPTLAADEEMAFWD